MAAKLPLKSVLSLGVATALAEWQAGDFLAIANGGTGAIDAAGARTALGLLIGTDIQAYSAATMFSNANATITKAMRGAASAIAYASTITLDMDTSNNFNIAALTGNVTLANPTHVTVGQAGVIALLQDGTGSRTWALGSNFKFEGGTIPTLSTAAGAKDLLFYCVPNSITEIACKLLKDYK